MLNDSIVTLVSLGTALPRIPFLSWLERTLHVTWEMEVQQRPLYSEGPRLLQGQWMHRCQ